MEDFVPLLAAVAWVYALANLVKQVAGGLLKEAGTQLAGWLLGVAVAFVLANSDFGSGIIIADETLGTLNAWSLVLVGVSFASGASVVYDALPISTPTLFARASPNPPH